MPADLALHRLHQQGGRMWVLEVSSRMPELPMFLCTSFVLQNFSLSHSTPLQHLLSLLLDAMPPVGRTRMQRLCVLIRLSTVHSGADSDWPYSRAPVSWLGKASRGSGEHDGARPCTWPASCKSRFQSAVLLSSHVHVPV